MRKVLPIDKINFERNFKGNEEWRFQENFRQEYVTRIAKLFHNRINYKSLPELFPEIPGIANDNEYSMFKLSILNLSLKKL